MLELDLATVLFQVLNFLVLTALLYKFMFGPIMQRVQARAAEKERLAHEMAEDRQAVADMRAELEKRLTHADKEAADIINQAQEKADAEREQLLQEAYAEAEQILERAQTDTLALKKQTLADFHDELLDTILEISVQVMYHVAPTELQGVLVEQLKDRIWEMGRSDIERVEKIRRGLGERTPTAYITTAQPLTPEQQGSLVRTFSALADRNVNLEMSTDPSLAAGLRVRLGDIVVDNSLAGQMDELRHNVTQSLQEWTSGGKSSDE